MRTQVPPTFVVYATADGEICTSRFLGIEDELVEIESEDGSLDGRRLPLEVAMSEIVDRAATADLTVIAVADKPLGSIRNSPETTALLRQGGVAIESEDGGSNSTIRLIDSALDSAPRELCELMVSAALTEVAYPSALPTEMQETSHEAVGVQFAIPSTPTYFDRFQLALLNASVLGGQADDSVRAVFTPHTCKRLEWSENGSNESVGRNEFAGTTIAYRNYEQGSVLVLGAQDIDDRLAWFSERLNSAGSTGASVQSAAPTKSLVFEYSALSFSEDGMVRGEQHEGMLGTESGIWLNELDTDNTLKLMPASAEQLAIVSGW